MKEENPLLPVPSPVPRDALPLMMKMTSLSLLKMLWTMSTNMTILFHQMKTRTYITAVVVETVSTHPVTKLVGAVSRDTPRIQLASLAPFVHVHPQPQQQLHPTTLTMTMTKPLKLKNNHHQAPIYPALHALQTVNAATKTNTKTLISPQTTWTLQADANGNYGHETNKLITRGSFIRVLGGMDRVLKFCLWSEVLDGLTRMGEKVERGIVIGVLIETERFIIDLDGLMLVWAVIPMLLLILMTKIKAEVVMKVVGDHANQVVDLCSRWRKP
ncbi:hypothetical protein BCR33DRAFT_93298 [Rhizoclosmatium globosum]|uniref:Uncharacterized protein n=1 Tax=Rhizoclosmatium globosum TaxID=329046 RepID=A0A1Y2CJR7_9FUNG|nr:hypothetical protein BCR33DRAFT_93298 [Rhizoclosmatium globosum]|eukprot:ORY47268.1 hypothetical protein BCR33DRAFT_93298 [Rhizoclosmatium globosum]